MKQSILKQSDDQSSQDGEEVCKKPVNFMLTQERKAPVFLSRRVRLEANEAAIVSLTMRIFNQLGDDKQTCVVPNPNSEIAAVL